MELEEIQKFMLPCLSKTLFGIECLGCGFQRSLFLLLQGEFQASFEMYPAIFTSLIFIASLLLNAVHKKGNYSKMIFVLAVINVSIMIAGYYYKHF
ncbi:DUF2752 domain-containing protein [Flavobacterium sp. K77]|uniref:DUF2752 domain-containing protein n=1 Tax=Flavobacterium sp. K77 TaxID=2910676 RepID=UPI001F15D4D7|nr:DUF2752 domain-containing protein [Flavobacterium sp. K77]MCF6140719.1 DUF2752 domain-containing protein [Flavobacterium sp. K77]